MAPIPDSYVLLGLAVYLTGGIGTVFVGPLAHKLRRERSSAKRQPRGKRRQASAAVYYSMVLVTIVLWPVLIISEPRQAKAELDFEDLLENLRRLDVEAEAIPTSWLQQRTSVAEAEVAHPGIRGQRASRFPEAAKPFGFANRSWESLKAEMTPGDELWTFSSPGDYWKNLAGSAGIALVRDGKPIRTITTLMN